MAARRINPYLLPQTSLRSRAARALWQLGRMLLFRASPRPWHAWRALVLRCFGARLGPKCHIYPGADIWAPWNLWCEYGAAIADGAIIYNAAEVHLGVHSIVSQQAFLCTASHDIDNPAFPMITAPISIGSFAWICARASVMPGVTVCEGAVLALGSVASGTLEAWQVYGGIPARRLRQRERHAKAIKAS